MFTTGPEPAVMVSAPPEPVVVAGPVRPCPDAMADEDGVAGNGDVPVTTTGNSEVSDADDVALERATVTVAVLSDEDGVASDGDIARARASNREVADA